MVRVGVIGYGRWGPNLARCVASERAFVLSAICDTSLAIAAAAVQHLNVRLESDPETVINDPRIDAVLLATPAINHYRSARGALRAGKHVLVEKPLALQSDHAEDALQVLAAGGTLEEVELPLYTTCSRLFGAGGDIREAVVSSALGQIGDLGGSRISKALGVFFAERNAPTLLVIDSLDEAHGPSERLRQASTLPWRVVLTSRPSSWRHQLPVKDADESHRVGELQPLDYPGDVEPFIERWFAGHPEQGHGLAAQIARRPGLQQAATVPLMLAFYCIVGGTGPLPEFRRDLYTRVLNRMLTGRWRDDDDRQPDAGTCLQTLRARAWDGAASHPVSGVGTWADDIAAKRVQLGEADADAVDHIAIPPGPPDVDDTETTSRRFIHRSVREHLVAGHVATLPVDQAVKVLLPHLWYDPDWEYAAPAALAMHPQRDQLLRDLICRAACSDQIPGDLSVIDAGWQARGLLARVAANPARPTGRPRSQA